MPQHFLLSAKARTLNLAQVARMTETQVETAFAGIRWPETNGKAVCPHCGCPTCYEARRPNGALRFRCKACRKDFSLTSGTIFAFHKMELRAYLLAISIFCNEVKGKSALALSRDLGVQYKTAFVLAHKLREAMASEITGLRLGGPGKIVEIDGGYFGGYVKPANHKENRVDRRLSRNQNGKRQCVVVIRERDGKVLPAAFRSEASAMSFIKNRVARETEIMVDEAASWNDLHTRYSVKTINHQVAYSLDGACTNGAESFFSRMRRAEQGHHHHISGVYLGRYAQESAWREDMRRVANGDRFAVW
jgi:transposase-like protein